MWRPEERAPGCWDSMLHSYARANMCFLSGRHPSHCISKGDSALDASKLMPARQDLGTNVKDALNDIKVRVGHAWCRLGRCGVWVIMCVCVCADVARHV